MARWQVLDQWLGICSRTQRSTKLSHASISIKFSPQNYSKFRICGIICGRSGIYRYFLYTVPPMKWLFVRDCRSSADFTLTVRYGIPNAALYQTEPHLVIKLNFLRLLSFYNFAKACKIKLHINPSLRQPNYYIYF